MRMQIHGDGRPRTASNAYGVAMGFTSLLVTLAITRIIGASPPAAMALGLAAYVVPIMLYDLTVAKVHRRPSTGLDWSLKRPFDPQRVAVKLIAMCGIYATLGVIYASLPPGVFELYRLFATGALLALPLLLFVSAIYIFLIDRVMVEPQDGYFEAAPPCS